MNTTARVWEAELALLDPAVRRDRDAVAALLADNFVEIGQSGRQWTRDEILDQLVAEEPTTAEPIVTQRQTQAVSDGVVLLTYRLDLGGRVSLRSSLWATQPSPRMLFHQGTTAASGA